MSLAAGLAGMEREADDIYDDGGAALGAPPASPAPPGRQQQTPYTVVSHEPVAIYADPALTGAPLGTLGSGDEIRGWEEDTEDADGQPGVVIRAEDDEGVFYLAVRGPNGERNVQSTGSRAAYAAPPAASETSGLARSYSRHGDQAGGPRAASGRSLDFNTALGRTKSVVRRPVNNKTLKKFRMSTALNNHALKDSEQVCVGASVKRMHIPRMGQCIPVNAEFMRHIEWAARGAVGCLVAALPSLLQYGWIDRMREGSYDFDPTFGAVAFIWVFSETVGQTNKFIFQAMVGSFVAAIVPQLAINTFGHETVAVLLFMFFYSIFVLSLPVEQITKKFSLGMCVMYLMRRAKSPDPIPKAVTYQVCLLGIIGCFCALLVCYLPFPRTAIDAGFKGIKNCVTDIQFCTRNLVEAYISGENLQDRARTLKYFEHMVVELRDLEHNIDFAWWEPWAQARVQKYKAVLLLIHKLRTDMYGMQKALMKRARDGMHNDIMEKRCFIQNESGAQTDSQDFNECIRDLMLTSLRTLREVVVYVAGEGETEWLNTQASRMSKDKMRARIEEDIQELMELRVALDRFHMDYSSIRSDFSLKPDEDRVERDAYLNVFLFNLTNYSQALLDFPSDYASGLETAQQSQTMFLPESKMVTFSFQKRQLISAFKTAAAITLAAGLNMQFFDYSFLSPTLVAYVMGGHVGGSWANTADRIVGLVSGMLCAYFFLIFTECNTYALGSTFCLVSMLSFYVRVSSKNHEYVGAVASFIQCLLMVDVSKCTTDTRLQLDVVEQIVLTCLIMLVTELVIAASSSALFYRKEVADTMLDALSIFKEVFDSHVNVNLDALKMRQKKDVDMALWRALPNKFHNQDMYLQSAMMEPSLWQPVVPFSGYQQLTTCGRRMNLHLILLHRALESVAKLRVQKDEKESFREQKVTSLCPPPRRPPSSLLYSTAACPMC